MTCTCGRKGYRADVTRKYRCSGCDYLYELCSCAPSTAAKPAKKTAAKKTTAKKKAAKR